MVIYKFKIKRSKPEIQNLKNPKRSFVRTIRKKLQGTCETFLLRFVRVAF